MSDSESIQALEYKLTQLQQHIEDQDSEIYQLSKRVDQLMQSLQTQKMQLESITGGGGGGMPADEKPPHY
jgi:flagellar biosynthesis chaperone FliJ